MIWHNSLVIENHHYRRGIDLFNRAEFFAAHEELEEVWRSAPENDRKFLQAFIQVAVALHHHSRGNVAGTRSLLSRALRTLTGYPDQFGGINLSELRQTLSAWQRAMQDGAALPALPQVQRAPRPADPA